MSAALGALGVVALVVAWFGHAQTCREMAETQHAVATTAWALAATSADPSRSAWCAFAYQQDQLSAWNARRAWPFRLREDEPAQEEGKHHVDAAAVTSRIG